MIVTALQPHWCSKAHTGGMVRAVRVSASHGGITAARISP